jgi:hypothetical protein
MFGGEPPPEYRSIIGLDLAHGGADFTALVVVERAAPAAGGPAIYAVRHLERWRDARSRRVVERVEQIVPAIDAFAARRDHERWSRHGLAPQGAALTLVVDLSGVGDFGAQPLRERGWQPEGVVITSGFATSHPARDRWNVPKRELVTVIGTLLDHDRLQLPADTADGQALLGELANFRRSLTPTGRERYAAGEGDVLWREQEHDDLVLATALACWWGETNTTPGRIDPVILNGFVGVPGWDD